MREITIGEKQIRVRATPLALLYYRQEFKADLIGDLISMQEVASDPTQFDSIKMLQLIWAMNKADKPEGFPSFEGWLSNLDSIDFDDGDMMTAVIEEAADGFFRGDKR
jgi:hypothetical protein